MTSTPEGINADAVCQWLTDNIDGLQPPLTYSLIAGGHSNLTFRVDDSNGNAYVLRRPPLGHVLQSAHDMGREHKIISALQDSDVPVAPALGLCEHVAVNDAPFYVMRFIDGQILHNTQSGALFPEAARHSLGEHVIDVLVNLHAIDPDTVGLGDLGRKEAYLARQLKRWNRQWEQTKTHEIPEMEESARLLAERMPKQVGATIVHGDYRLGNMIVNDGANGPRIDAVLDWELCALGDPLADVGYLLNQWVAPGEPLSDQFPTGCGGYPSRDYLCRRYEKLTGRDLADINYYRAFSWWRLGAIGQGVYKRYLEGAMGTDRDVDLETMKENVRSRAVTTLELLST